MEDDTAGAGDCSRVCLLYLAPFGWTDGYEEAWMIFQDVGTSGGFFESSYGYALFPTTGTDVRASIGRARFG